MINLLPTATKESIAFARRNRVILTWLVAVVAGFAGVVAIIVAGQLYIHYSVSAYETTVSNSKQQLQDQKLEETKSQVSDISNSVKLTNQVLAREIPFSKLLQGIGAAMPPGASLQNLSIGELDGGIDLQVVATDYQTATQVQVNLQDENNKVFDKADILNISCSTDQEAVADSDGYPCQISLRATFAKNSPYTQEGNQ